MGYIMAVRRHRRARRFRATFPHFAGHVALLCALGVTYLVTGSWVVTAIGCGFILAFAAARGR